MPISIHHPPASTTASGAAGSVRPARETASGRAVVDGVGVAYLALAAGGPGDVGRPLLLAELHPKARGLGVPEIAGDVRWEAELVGYHSDAGVTVGGVRQRFDSLGPR